MLVPKKNERSFPEKNSKRESEEEGNRKEQANEQTEIAAGLPHELDNGFVGV
jgi:hypothetical protein